DPVLQGHRPGRSRPHARRPDLLCRSRSGPDHHRSPVPPALSTHDRAKRGPVGKSWRRHAEPAERGGVMTDEPPGPVVLVCGASAVGKSRAASGLATRYGTPLAEADDIVTALRVMTDDEQQPLLHYWDNHPEAMSWPGERIADLHLSLTD